MVQQSLKLPAIATNRGFPNSPTYASDTFSPAKNIMKQTGKGAMSKKSSVRELLSQEKGKKFNASSSVVINPVIAPKAESKNEKDSNDDDPTSDGGSGLGDKTKDVQKKKASKLSKSLNRQAYTLDKKNKKLIEKFNQMAVDRRIQKNRLKEFLIKRYKEGLSNRFMNIIGTIYDFTQNQSMEIDNYCQLMEKIFNQDDASLKRLAFKIFDTNQDKKVSEKDMFELMNMCTGQGKPGHISVMDDHHFKDNEILKLGKKRADIFIDIFASDYIKIVAAIEKKKEAKGIKDEYYKRQAATDMGLIGAKDKAGRKNNKVNLPNINKFYNTDEFSENDQKEGEKKKTNQAKQKEDDFTFGITEAEFLNIQFDMDWPHIIKDLSFYLTGQDLLVESRINEAEELQHHNMIERCKESDIAYYKIKMLPSQFSFAVNCFRAFQLVKEPKLRQFSEVEKWVDLRQNFIETSIYLEEHNFIENINKVFDEHTPAFFGKMLYVYMAKGYDKVKISLLRFLECMYPLFNNENRFNHNKIVFHILDIDQDGGLNIQNLLHLYKNLDPRSRLGNDIFKLILFFIEHFLSKKQTGASQNMTITYDLFAKIIGRSCLIDAIRQAIFGQTEEGENYGSIFKINYKQEFKHDYIFKDIDVLEDVSYGQRGFNRNLDALLIYLQKKKEEGKKKEIKEDKNVEAGDKDAPATGNEP